MKRMVFSMLFVTWVFNSHAQQLAAELFNDVNGPHPALRMFEGGRHGKCNILSPGRNCRLDAVTVSEGAAAIQKGNVRKDHSGRKPSPTQYRLYMIL